MRTFFRGNDRGNAVLAALVFILVFSFLFLSLTRRITALRRFSYTYKEKMLENIRKDNQEIRRRYDLD